MQVSIIIPTRNEARNLPRLLKSIAEQQGVDCEVIVVDQESDDQTQAIAASFDALVITRAPTSFYSPPSQSRNLGAEHATGEILLHLDADMELPSPRFLTRLIALFDHSHSAAIIHETDVAQGWWNRVKAAERACYWDTPLECARAVKATLFKEIGGYDAAISSGEDMYIQQQYAARTTVARSKDVWLYHHTGRIPLKRLLTKKYNYGRTSRQFLDASQQAGGHSAISWMTEALKAYATHPAVAKRQPFVFACILPLRFAELIAVQLGMRRSKAKR